MLAGAFARPPQSDDLGTDLSLLAPSDEAAIVDLGVDDVAWVVWPGEEQDHTRGMALAQLGHHPVSRVRPALRHPGDVGHDARAQARRLPGLGGRVSKLVELPLDVPDGDVLQHGNLPAAPGAAVP